MPLQLVFDDGRRSPGENVIGTNQEEPFLAEFLPGPCHRGEDLLVGCGAEINDIRRLLQSFELHGVKKQVVELLDNHNHRLATGRGPASDEYSNFLLSDK